MLKTPAILAAAALITMGSGVALAATGDRELGRIAGSDRYTTAVAISQEAFPNSASAVYLARADAFADALAGSSLTDKGPILLVPQCGTVPPAVIAEVNRLQPLTVKALGGPGAVCDAVVDQFAGAIGDGASGDDSVTLSGGGEVNTDPFLLEGGNYKVTYNFSGSDCFYGAFLQPTNNDNASGHSIASGTGPFSGETNLYDVDPTEYYIQLIGGQNCPWTITLTGF